MCKTLLIVTAILVTAIPLVPSFSTTEEPPQWRSVGSFGFESDKPGSPPSGFHLAKSESGKPGRWVVQQAADAPDGNQVLVQADSDRSRDRFLMAIVDGPELNDVRLTTRCKPLSGSVDQACGLVFRHQDERNYYVTRANALKATCGYTTSLTVGARRSLPGMARSQQTGGTNSQRRRSTIS